MPSGADGLTSVDLVFDEPNTSLGIYDTIKVFLTDSSGVYDPATDELPIFNVATPSVVGVDSTTLSLKTMRTIKGLVNDTEYCFIVKAYSTSPADPESPNGRTHINEKKVCYTPRYTYPVFSGLNTNCSNATSTGFDVSWNTPSPLGIFTRYDLFIKIGPSGFNYTDAINEVAGYTRIAINSDQNDYSLTGLLPSSTYQIGIKTYFEHPITADIYRDHNLKVISCNTTPATATHQGWIELFAIGPKINGLTGQPILETLTTSAAGNIVPKDVDDATRNLTRVTPVTGVNAVSASKNGIVRLVWEDFQLSGGAGGLYDFQSYANTGYRVYRQAWKPEHDNLPPTLSDPLANWTELTPDPIVPKRKIMGSTGQYVNYGEFTDYTLAHPGSDDAKIYWYMVLPYTNNIRVNFTTVPSDGIVKMILPASNMAFAHRWIINKDICELMRLPIERANNYRCAYNGLGSKDGYYDMEGHLLIDRFHLGCNFTRGSDPDPDKRCRVAATATNPTFLGNVTNPTSGQIEGDCIGDGYYGYMGHPNYKTFPPAAYDSTGYIEAKYGSVYYTRYSYSTGGATTNNCHYNSSAGIGSSWKPITQFELSATSQPTSSIIPINTPETPNGQGWGAKFTTNNANMPFVAMPQITAQKFCMGHKVDLNGKVYQKRLPRRREFIGYAGMDPFMDRATMLKVIGDQLQTTVTTNDQDCFQANSYASRNIGGVANGSFTFNSNRYAYHNYSVNSLYHKFVTGSQGDQSTESCVSRYGVSDIFGLPMQHFSDQMWCDAAWGCNVKYKDAAATIPINLIDPEGAEYLKTQDGQYLNFQATNSVGFPLTAPNYYTNTPLANYFSIPTGHYLSCSGTACDGGTDDNVLVSHRTEAQVSNPLTQIYSYNPLTTEGGTAYYSVYAIAPQLISYSSHFNGPQAAGRYVHSSTYWLHGDDVNPADNFYAENGVRCLTLLKENADNVIE